MEINNLKGLHSLKGLHFNLPLIAFLTLSCNNTKQFEQDLKENINEISGKCQSAISKKYTNCEKAGNENLLINLLKTKNEPNNE